MFGKNSPYSGLLDATQQKQLGWNMIGDVGMGLLANSGWQTMPTSLGANLGKAGQGAMQNMNQNAMHMVKADDIETQRRSAAVAAQRAAWEHQQKLKAASKVQQEEAGLRAIAPNYGLPSDSPLSEIKAAIDHDRAMKLERAKAGLKPLPGLIGQYTLAKKNGEIPPSMTFSEYANKFGDKGTVVNMGNTVANLAFEQLKVSKDQAMAAVEQIDNLNRMSTALMKGANIGPGSKISTGIDQVASILGVGGSTTSERLANTRTVLQGMARMTLAGRGSLKGQGQITEGEQALLARAMSGDPTEMTAQEIGVIMNVAARVASSQYSGHLSNLEIAKQIEGVGPAAGLFQVPALPTYNAPVFGAPAPSGAAPSQPTGTFLGFETPTGKR